MGRRRVDLLGEAANGRLVHIELQSRNDPSMPLRMLEYGVMVARREGRYPKQVVLYVGKAPMRMERTYRSEDDLNFKFDLVDIRELDGERLLHSRGLGDNVLAILTGLGDNPEAVRKIVSRIAKLDDEERQSTLQQLSILAGLREWEPLVREEVDRVPVTENILNHPAIRPAYRKGRREGREAGLEAGLKQGLQKGLRKGRREGREEGLHQGELTVLKRLIVKRFGEIPAWLEERLAKSPAAELEQLGERLLDAQTLEDLVK
jgi:predicted transposase YdaD